MEKSKVKRPKIIQITYPAPYLHSWNSEAAPVMKKHSPMKTRRLFHNPRRIINSSKGKSQSYNAVRGPDPTAPHLKYGVFNNKRIVSNREQSKVKQTVPIPKTRRNTLKLKASEELASRNSRSASNKRPARIRESPVFVFRTVDKSFTRQLSKSRIMHVDIKPKKNIMSAPPRFCPSPNQRLGPLMIRSPVRRRKVNS